MKIYKFILIILLTAVGTYALLGVYDALMKGEGPLVPILTK